MFSVIEAARAGLFAPRNWPRNIIAGITVGVIALPLALAFAIASGVKPEQGIYTAIIAGLAVSLFGGSRVQIAGPTGAFIVILSAIVAEYGVEGLLLATMMAGVILCAFALARLGAVIRFIPSPVIIGFTSGIAIIIFVGQWHNFFGLPSPQGSYFHQKLWHLLQSFPDVNLLTMLFGVGSLILVLLPRFIPSLRRIPGPLLAMLVAALVQGLSEFSQVATIGSAFGEIPRGLPGFALPRFSPGEMIGLIGPAFTIAMLGAIESLLSAVVADGMAGTRHNSNAELFGQGIANILSPLFGGIAATGALARTSVNIRSGGNSPLAGIVHSIILILVLVLLAPLARYVPLATLAAVLFAVAWDMSEAKRFIQLVRRAPVADTVILLVTFFLTVFADLVIAVNVGILLAILQFMRRMAGSVEVSPRSAESLSRKLEKLGLAQLPQGVEVHEVQGPLFFAAIDRAKRAFSASKPNVVILLLDDCPFVDATALLFLEELIARMTLQGQRLVLSGANKRVLGKLRRMGLIARLGKDGVQPDLMSALESLPETPA
jgi:SulP family sulfate permease